MFSINENNDNDSHVSFKDENNQWQKPINLGAQLNITTQDFAPSLSQGGKFIFFSNNGKLRWVSTNLLESLRNE